MGKTGEAGVRAIAVVEAVKGALVVVAGVGLLATVHQGAERVAEDIVSHFHLNPGSRIPRIFLEAAAHADNANILLLAAGAAAYAALRFVEAYGLWHRRPWGEWLGILSGAMYLPIEIYEILQGFTPVRAGLLLVNLLVVLVLLRAQGSGLHHCN